MSISVEPLQGAALAAALPDLARLRMAVFREWPYLYQGTLDYEQSYVEKFARSQGAVIVAARDGGRVVGAATASPMAGHADAFAEPFRVRGYDIATICYFGELVLLAEYRGHGVGHAFFDHREAHARKLGAAHAAFCGVVRPDDHPLRPTDYRPLDGFWKKRGYQRMEGFLASFDWLDIGEGEKTAKQMQFWMKAL